MGKINIEVSGDVGAGKSTLVRFISRHLKESGFNVTVEGKEVVGTVLDFGAFNQLPKTQINLTEYPGESE